MKKELILHIGMGKTGTTALQEFFSSNRSQLGEIGISYPEHGTVSNAHHLLSPYLPNKLKDSWKFESVEEWAPKLLALEHQKILLSSELIAWASVDEVTEFCKRIKKYFTPTVVVYVRRQDNIIMANYNQLVKSGSQRRELEEVWEDDCARFNYWRILQPWANCLGKSSIVVRPYEKEQFYGGDIRHDFMRHVFDIELSSGYVIAEGDSNPRLHPHAIAFKLCLFKIFSDPDRVGEFDNALLSYSRELDSSHGGVLSSEALLSPKVRNLIIQRQKASNAMVAREFLNRQDGVLFRDSYPDSKSAWARSKLSRAEARAICNSCVKYDPALLHLVVDAVSESLGSIDLSSRKAAQFIKRTLPKSEIARLEKQSVVSVFQWKYRPEKSKRENVPYMLISVHFPVVTADCYLREISRVFGDGFVSDYEDRPLGMHDAVRNISSLISSIQHAALVHDSEEAMCVHGHFMPLKYRFLQSNLRKRYVTWVRDPVERLTAHYYLWKSRPDRGYSGELRRRMLEEDWSLERFAFCPELRNIYSKYLWGFPLRRFDFVGIAEFPEMECHRFLRDVLGVSNNPAYSDDTGSDVAANSNIDAGFRKRVEQFHGADAALYQQALQIRRDSVGDSINV